MVNGEQIAVYLCILYNQRDATYTKFFIIIAGVDGLVLSFHPIHTSGTQQESMTIPKAAHTVL
jgi:hypothetical protein